MACYTINCGDNGNGWICGDLGPHCTACFGVGDHLCDYPVGNDKTCDAAICEGHALEVAENVHYCPGHAKIWKAFRVRPGPIQAIPAPEASND